MEMELTYGKTRLQIHIGAARHQQPAEEAA
jgi:hypothetical protein